MQSRVWTSHLSPWQASAFWLLSLSHSDCKMATSAPGITSSYNSIKGRGNFPFYHRGKMFPKLLTPATSPWSHWPDLGFTLPAASTPLKQLSRWRKPILTWRRGPPSLSTLWQDTGSKRGFCFHGGGNGS